MRGFCSRVLGWTTDREVVVKQAIRSIDLAATHQAALVLCGDGDLVQVARGVHRHALGDAEVHARIIGGSLCLRSWWLPLDFIICAEERHR